MKKLEGFIIGILLQFDIYRKTLYLFAWVFQTLYNLIDIWTYISK